MRFELSDEQQAYRDELRGYFARVIDPRMEELRREMKDNLEGGGPIFRSILEELGADGQLGVGWPTEYGGQGRSALEQYIFTEEVQRTGFPLPFLTLNTVGPTIRRFASDAQKAEILPQILAGKLLFAIGYSEAEAGTDLASLKTRAVRDGDEWVINGLKWFTSAAFGAKFAIVMATRQPCPSLPSMRSWGIRTSLKKTSLNSASPVIW